MEEIQEKKDELTNRVEHRGPNPSFLQIKSTAETRHSSADDSDSGVVG